MPEGFVLTRQWLEKPDGQDLVFWLATDSGPVKVVIENHESVFFLPLPQIPAARRILGDKPRWRDAAVPLRDFQQTAVHACYFTSQKDLNVARSRLWQANVQPLEADVRPTDRYLMERFITGAMSVEGDAEVLDGLPVYRNPRLLPVEYIPQLLVVSLDIETSYTENILYSIAVSGLNLAKVFMVLDSLPPDHGDPALDERPDYLESVATEAALIERFLEWFAVLDPDVVIGWNVVGFDLRFCRSVVSSTVWLSRWVDNNRRCVGDLPARANSGIMPWCLVEWSSMALSCFEPRPINLRASVWKMSRGFYWGAASWFMMLIAARQKSRSCMHRTRAHWLAIISKTVCW